MVNQAQLLTELHDTADRHFRSLDCCPALVLNADYTPLSYLPLSLWPWQDAIKAVWMDRVTVLATYNDRFYTAANNYCLLHREHARRDLVLPTLTVHRVCTQCQHGAQTTETPAFTRRNLYLRDGYHCGYCMKHYQANDLSFDHVLPRRYHGPTRCNNAKGDCHPTKLSSIGMKLRIPPLSALVAVAAAVAVRRHVQQLPYSRDSTMYAQRGGSARKYPPKAIHESWAAYLYYDAPLDGPALSQLTL
eukprot:1947-Heterococcus_DN1.PRE.1